MTVIPSAEPAARQFLASMTESGLPARLWLGRRRFAAVFAVIVVLVVIAYLLTPVSYLATGSVIVAEADPANANPSAVWSQKVGDPADLESQLIVLRSPRVIRLASQRPGVAEAARAECDGSRFSLFGRGSCAALQPGSPEIVGTLEDRYSVDSVGRSRVISISYRSSKPEVAQQLANALIGAYLDDQKGNLAAGREVATSWLWEKLKELDAEIRTDDAKIQEFRSTRGLLRGQTAPISAERLSAIGQQLANAEAARAAVAARLDEIRQDQAHHTANAPSVLASRGVAELKQQLSAAEERMAAAESVLGPRHPQIATLQSQIETLRRGLATEVANVLSSAEKEHAAAGALVDSLRAQLTKSKFEAAVASTDETSIEAMVRGTEIKRRQYADLYERASALETERRILLGSTRLVSLAELPSKPFFPKKVPFFAAGLTLALLAAAAATLYGEPLGHRPAVPVPQPAPALAPAPVAPATTSAAPVAAPAPVEPSAPRRARETAGADVPLRRARRRRQTMDRRARA